MATANQDRSQSVISSEAVELLDCFSNGLEDLIFTLAERTAKQRAAEQSTEINASDIESAAQLLVHLLQESDVPDEVRPVIDSMLQCFSEKIRHRHR